VLLSDATMSAAERPMERRADERQEDARPSPDHLHVHFHLPTRTIVKLVVAALVIWAGVRLWPEFILLLVAVLLAVALHPVVIRLEGPRLPRPRVIAVLAGVLGLVAVVLVSFVFTSLADEISKLARDFPTFRARIEENLPADHPMLKKAVGVIFSLPYSPEVAVQLKKPLVWGSTAASGGMAVFFTVILTLYFLLDGRRLYAWLIAYVPRVHRDKMAVTMEEVSAVIYAYVRGQVITSVLFFTYVAIVLHAFHIPAAFPLAILAGFCDVIPVVGIIVATLPAALLALTVSPAATAAVLSLYILYHAVESYLIVPKIYGQRLRLSTLAVLLALVAGNTLAGLIGAVLVLPLVAAYPIIERIWLAGYLSPEVLKDHRALARSAETGNESAVETVLQGHKHDWEGPTGTSSGLATWLRPTRGGVSDASLTAERGAGLPRRGGNTE
jgi:predicted PurR-regulated permease PerM